MFDYIEQFAEKIKEMVFDKVEGKPTTYDEAIITYSMVIGLLSDRITALKMEEGE